MEPPTDIRKKQPRKKARRSCLYCQRAHKTCGNERPCGQCVERGSPSECVDGKRKPPKYLFEPLVKRKRVRTRKTRDATTSGNKNPASGNMTITSYAHPLPLGGRHNSHTGNAPTPRRDPFEDIFNQTIDPNCFFAAVLGSDFEEQTLTNALGKEGPDPFCRGEHWRRSEELSSEPESSEAGISDQFLEDAPGFQSSGCQIPPNQRIYYGFAIGSGWSGTFFPDG